MVSVDSATARPLFVACRLRESWVVVVVDRRRGPWCG